jgi:hypothetical protein
MIFLGFVIAIGVFLYAVKQISRRTVEQTNELQSIKSKLISISLDIKECRDRAEKQLRELEEINKTLTGGLTALIAIGAKAHNVDLTNLDAEFIAKGTQEQDYPPYETLTAFTLWAWAKGHPQFSAEDQAAEEGQGEPQRG